MTGLVLSMLTAAGSVAVLPALSWTVPVTAWAWPSVVTVCGPVQLATPDSASEQVNVTVTSSLFQPSPFAAGLWAWPMVGDVLSMPKLTVCAASVLPAASVLQNFRVWLPSAGTGTLVPAVCGPPSSWKYVLSTPDSPSFGTRVSVTSLLFHAGGAVTVVFGAVRSILTGALWALVELPALSVAVLLAVRAVPSPVIVLLAGFVVPDTASAAVQATATSPLYQPAAFGSVVGLPESEGATLSMLMPLTVVLE